MNVKRILLPLALGTLVVMTLVQAAGATHPRPKGATPTRVSLAPAYKACATPNRTHGAPLAFPSCNPPSQSSGFLTVGTPDANGAAANSIGFALLKVRTASPEDLLIKSTVSDVRCKAGTAPSVCSAANAADGPDYSGELQGTTTIRVSDHYNGPGLNEAATVMDIPLPVNIPCANTADTASGGVCAVDTSANAVQPGAIPDGGVSRAVIELGQVRVSDGGSDGAVSTADNTTFATQGVFIP
jgi:hypothetical protein